MYRQTYIDRYRHMYWTHVITILSIKHIYIVILDMYIMVLWYYVIRSLSIRSYNYAIKSYPSILLIMPLIKSMKTHSKLSAYCPALS